MLRAVSSNVAAKALTCTDHPNFKVAKGSDRVLCFDANTGHRIQTERYSWRWTMRIGRLYWVSWLTCSMLVRSMR